MLGELRALVFLQEVAGVLDRRMRLALAARNRSLEEPVGAPRDGVGVAEERKEWLLPRLEHLPCRPVRIGRGVVRRDRYQRWECARARGELVAGERGVVSVDDCRIELGDATALHDT